MASDAEAEIGALFENTKSAAPLCHALEETVYPQFATPLQTENSTASGIANKTIHQKHSKSINMYFN